MYGHPEKGYLAMAQTLTTDQKKQVRKDLQDFHEKKASPMLNSGELLAITQRVLETLAIQAGVFEPELTELTPEQVEAKGVYYG